MRRIDKVSLKGKVALPRIRGKALLSFAFCFIFSVAMWMLQVFRETNSASFQIPLQYTNIPNDLIFLDSLPQSVTIQVKDKGLSLINHFFLGDDDPLLLDCAPFFFDNDIFQVTTLHLEQMLRVRFPSGEISVTQPQTIHSYYTKGFSKRVPIRLRLSATFARQKIQSGSVLISPEFVTAYASAANLEMINEVSADSISLENLNDTTTIIALLPRYKGVKLVPDRVNVTIPVESYVEKHFTVKIQPQNVPECFTLKTFPQEVSIVCLLPMSRYRDVNQDQFVVGVRYSEDETVSELPVELIRKPTSASVVKMKPEKVEILLEKK